MKPLANRENDSEPAIWTDNENSRSLIWRAYWGFVDNYDNYMMYKNQFGRNHDVYKAGVYKHSLSFFHEVIDLIGSFKVEYADEVEGMIYNNTIFESDENLFKLRRFISSFMFQSGIKKIVYNRDKRDGVRKIADNYGV